MKSFEEIKLAFCFYNFDSEVIGNFDYKNS